MKADITWAKLKDQTISTGAAAAYSAAVSAQTYAVRLIASAACHVTLGEGSAAPTSSSMLLAANVPEIFAIKPGEKVGAIQDAAAGTLYITELTH